MKLLYKGVIKMFKRIRGIRFMKCGKVCDSYSCAW